MFKGKGGHEIMDFAQRNNAPAPTAGAPAPKSASGKKSNKKWSAIVRWSSVVLLFSVVVLIIALVASIAFAKTNQQGKYVAKDQYQAVFLNGGQVYFGKIGAINEKYLTLSNIYYLRVNQTVQPDSKAASSSNDVSLVKLGCELHGPADQMVINNDQVVFWENLKTDGQVAKAVAEFQKQNPNGQNCAAAATTDTTKKQ